MSNPVDGADGKIPKLGGMFAVMCYLEQDLNNLVKDRPTRRQCTMTCNAHNSVNNGSM